MSIWQAAVTTQPPTIYFNGVRGTLVGSIGAVDAEYKWFWAANVLYVWSPNNDDPSGHYTGPGIEALARTHCINSVAKDYVTVTGIETRHGTQYGIRARGNNWHVTLCNAHHIGTLGQSWPCEGIAVEGGSNCLVDYNSVSHAIRHGIAVAAFQDQTASTNIIEHNAVFDCYHTCIDLSNAGPNSVASGNIVRYNECFADADFADWSITCNGIYGIGSSGLPLTATEIYYNLVHNIPGKGIHLYNYCTNSFIYNNTCAYQHASHATTEYGIVTATTGVSGNIIKNNIAIGFNGADLWVEALAGVSAVDNNCWYTSGAGAHFAAVAGVNYDLTEVAAYKSATGFDTNGKFENPLFVSSSDFHLQGTSPCINAGVDVGLTADYEGKLVPQ